jgi:hypothetical protein
MKKLNSILNTWDDFSEKHLQWDKIKQIQETKIVKSTIYWLVLIPLFIKIGIYFEVNIDLSNNLFFLYIVSLIFFISSILYWIFCPEIIAKFGSSKKFTTNDFNEKIAEYCGIYGVSYTKDIINDNNKKLELFNKCLNRANSKKSIIKNIIYLLYFAGFLILMFLLYDNSSIVYEGYTG